MASSKPLLTLNTDQKKDGDRRLLRWLRDPSFFSFISPKTRKYIAGLELTEGDDLRLLHKELMELWPKVLTDCLLQLKREDAREYDNSNPKMDSFFDAKSLGTIELQEVLKGFCEFEGMMYGASPEHYRDHVVHSFRVWIIGQKILKHLRWKLSVVGGLKGLKISKSEWECMWAIAALCHDIGYPLSKIEQINERAQETLRKQGLISEGDMRFGFRRQIEPFHDTIIRLMASKPIELFGRAGYGTHLQNKYYLKLLKSFERQDHGIVSSLLISKALVYFLESDFSHDIRKPLDKEDVRQFLIRREILQAIAAHTCPELYHLKFDTLSFVLYIVDEVQCWGRPTLEELQHEATSIGEGSASIEEFSSKAVKILIKTEDEEWNIEQERQVLNQILKLRTMLRLAVDTKIPDALARRLEFEVRNAGEQILRLEFKDRGISVIWKGISKDVIEEVPMLKVEELS